MRHRYRFEAILPQGALRATFLAAVCWLILVLLFLSMAGYFEPLSEETNSSLGSSLFFACILVYAVFFGAWVLRRSAELV